MSKGLARSLRTDVKVRDASGEPTPARTVRAGQPRAREERVETVMAAARRSGLLAEKSSRIAGRVSPALIEQAKRRTGIMADTELIAFALANVALEDNFTDAFKQAHGKIDPGLKLGL